MSNESIQQLIEAFVQMGDGAKEGFIWYLIMFYGSKIVIFALGMITIVFVAKSIFKITDIYVSSTKLRQAAGCWGDSWREKDLRLACEILEKNKDKF